MISVTTLGWRLPCILPGWDFTPLLCYILLWSALCCGCSLSQIRWGEKLSKILKQLKSPTRKLSSPDHILKHLCVCAWVVADEPWHLLCGVRAVQRGVGHSVSGAVEEEGGWAGVQVGNTGHACWIPGGATASVPGARNYNSGSFHLPILFSSLSGPLILVLSLPLQGVKRCSPITGCEEFYYPPWRRRVFRWLVSLPICILCLCFVFLVMLICFELQVSQLSVILYKCSNNSFNGEKST